MLEPIEKLRELVSVLDSHVALDRPIPAEWTKTLRPLFKRGLVLLNEIERVTKDLATSSVQIIQELHGGVPQDPEAFSTEQSAGERFEAIVSAPYSRSEGVGFRKRSNGESWKEYYDAFFDWYNDETPGNGYPGDTLEWEIHWYETDIG